jgi:hypothetical protein
MQTDPTFVERGYLMQYSYTPQKEIITPDFPTQEEINVAFFGQISRIPFETTSIENVYSFLNSARHNQDVLAGGADTIGFCPRSGVL